MPRARPASLPRWERLVPETDGQQDRDRILYSSAFRRLAGVTQVVSPAEGQVFHNRLTHSLKVAQIGRQMAESLRRNYHQSALLRKLGPIDADVVEAACLAHDLGHPPFGHVVEQELSDRLLADGVADAFEGNAQSFRIVTRLSAYRPKYGGLNLTRATLNALLKYPWLRDKDGSRGTKAARKWGAYDSEHEIMTWVRGSIAAYGEPGSERCVEAELMDWADDVAYAFHDLEDFYRAGIVPMHVLREEGAEQNRFLRKAMQRIKDSGATEGYLDDEIRDRFKELVFGFPVDSKFTGTHVQRAGLRGYTHTHTVECIGAIKLVDPDTSDDRKTVKIDKERKIEVALLKELTWYYVINNPAMATQQDGQRRVVRTLYAIYKDALDSKNWFMFPDAYRDTLMATEDRVSQLRGIVDYIASMGEAPAIRLYQRLTGSALGSLSDPVPIS